MSDPNTTNLVGSPILTRPDPAEPHDDEYGRFEQLAHRLVQVPKRDLDAKRSDG